MESKAVLSKVMNLILRVINLTLTNMWLVGVRLEDAQYRVR